MAKQKDTEQTVPEEGIVIWDPATGEWEIGNPVGYPRQKPSPARCSFCGKFVSWEKVHSRFTPDSEFTAEEWEYYCDSCWEKYR